MTIRNRYVLHAINTNSFTVFIILLAISLSVSTGRVLDNVTHGRIDESSIAVFLLLWIFTALPFVVQISGVIGVLQTYQRFYADSEMVIWESSGTPLHHWIKPTMKVVVGLSFVVGILILFVRPWMFSVQQQLTHQYENKKRLVNTSPGVFQHIFDQKATLYIEESTQDNLLKRVFLFRPVVDNASHKGRYQLIVAKQGYITPAQSSMVHFERGLLYDITTQPQQFYRIAFSALDLNTQSPYQGPKAPYYGLSLIDLLQLNNASSHAELFWRLSIIVQTVIMGLFSLGLSYTPPRKRNYINVLTLLAVGMIYYNLINILKSFIEQQRIDPIVFFIILHLGFLIVGYGSVFIRSYHFSWRRCLFQKSSRA